MKYASVLDLIGNTPLVDISVMSPNPRVEIWAKLEGQNPSGSVKDRIALFMIDEAERAGKLKPKRALREAEPKSSSMTSFERSDAAWSRSDL